MKRFLIKQGFSLVEFSIVLVIISLILGGVLGGIQVYNRAKLTAVLDQESEIAQAFLDFRKKYHAVPGDMFDASSRIAGVTQNGNGNDLLDTTIAAGPPRVDEYSLAFNHLTQAGLLKGSHPGDWAPENVWKGPHDGSHFFFCGTNLSICYGRYEDLDGNGSINGFTESKRSILSPRDARTIDLKYDDGNPNTGMILGAAGFPDWSSNPTICVTAGGEYANSNEIGCTLDFVINRETW